MFGVGVLQKGSLTESSSFLWSDREKSVTERTNSSCVRSVMMWSIVFPCRVAADYDSEFKIVKPWHKSMST